MVHRDRQRMIGLRPRCSRARQCRPIEVPGRGSFKALRLDDRDELHVRRTKFPPQEPVDCTRAVRVVAVHAGQRVERDARPPQRLRRRVNLVEGRLAAFGHTDPVVQFARAVDRQADEKAVGLEEFRPVLVEQHAAGLQIVLDALARPGVPALQSDDLLEEGNAEQRRLATLPGKDDLVAGHALDVALWMKRSSVSSLMCPAPGPPGSLVLLR